MVSACRKTIPDLWESNVRLNYIQESNLRDLFALLDEVKDTVTFLRPHIDVYHNHKYYNKRGDFFLPSNFKCFIIYDSIKCMVAIEIDIPITAWPTREHRHKTAHMRKRQYSFSFFYHCNNIIVILVSDFLHSRITIIAKNASIECVECSTINLDRSYLKSNIYSVCYTQSI